ncbi:MAG: response regulator transcription factor [Gemmatimonadetes bacterium]|nr:response regulator transcription factor [Gemmatimonadota bacterium]
MTDLVRRSTRVLLVEEEPDDLGNFREAFSRLDDSYYRVEWAGERARPGAALPPVLIRTGAEGEEAEVELLEAGADEYLTKSIQPDRVMARVRAVLRRAAL